MTVLLGLMKGDLTSTVTMDSLSTNLETGSSTIPLQVGETINFKDLLYATMVRSGNDGANLIAETIGGSIEGFVDLMNQTAQSMGTTLTLIWESAAELLIAHVGDSRAYLYRGGCLECRTQDHSIVGELLRNKAITPEMAKTHPYRSVITRALGTDPIVQPDVFRVEKQTGDVWLLCSDGLYNMVEDAEIASTLEAQQDEPAADRLLTLALEHGGSDNVSLVLGRVTEVNAP